MFYYRWQLVLLQGETLFYHRANWFFYKGQPCFTTGGKLILKQGATLLYYRRQTRFTTGGKLTQLQGATLFYYRGQTCFTTGGKLVLPQGLTLQRWWRGEGGGGNCINLHKPFDLILLDLQLTMDMITIKSYAS